MVLVDKVFLNAPNPHTKRVSDCNCNAKGSVSYDCDLYTEQCDCKASVVGLKCDECQVTQIIASSRMYQRI